jgi:hypothetical protein
VTERATVPFSAGPVEFVRTSVGSAIDGEEYELKFHNGGKTQTFFKGRNFTEFHPAERNGKFAIQICHGSIEQADPILIGEGENLRVVRLDIDWNCQDKSHDA